MKNLSISLFFFFIFVTRVFADGFCGNSILVSLTKGSDGVSFCPETVADYPYTLDSGCSITQSSIVGCLYVYKICCGDTSKKYQDSTVSTLLAQSVEVGREEQASLEKYEEFKNSAISPVCASGFSTTSEMMGYVYYVTPSYSTSDYTKSDVAVSAWNRVGCSKFTNNTTVTLNPIQSGGGTTAESIIELQAINTALSTIKTVLDSIPNSTNPLLTDIKTLLQTGLNFNSEALETGTNQVAVNTNQIGVNTAAGNEILTAINNKLTQNCATVWDPNGGTCTWYDYDRDGIPETQVCTGGNVTTCEGLDVSDSASLAKLQEIKDAIIAGGGGTVNADMTETNNRIDTSNGFLSTVKDTLIDIKNSLSSLVNGSMSDTSAPAAYTPDLSGAESQLGEVPQLFTSFINEAKSTEVIGLVSGTGSFFNSIPSGGSSVVSFDGGRYGQHSFDFSSWGSILDVIKTLVLLICSYVSLKIIFLKG